MQKILFKNMYLNIIIGVGLIILAFLGYFLGWFEDFLPYFVSAILLLLSTKRFWYSFKKIVSKYATLILIVEYILDIVFAGLLIYTERVDLFMGLIIYSRGVSYLLINYIATRKIKLFQYLLNIGYVTIGAYFMFATLNTAITLVFFISFVSLVIGCVYLQHGVRAIVAKEQIEDAKEKQIKFENKITKENQKADDKIRSLEKQVKEIKENHKEVIHEANKLKEQVKEIKEVEKPQKTEVKELPKVEPKKEDSLSTKTVVELKEIAKNKGITGISALNKSELIEVIRKQK